MGEIPCGCNSTSTIDQTSDVSIAFIFLDFRLEVYICTPIDRTLADPNNTLAWARVDNQQNAVINMIYGIIDESENEVKDDNASKIVIQDENNYFKVTTIAPNPSLYKNTIKFNGYKNNNSSNAVKSSDSEKVKNTISVYGSTVRPEPMFNPFVDLLNIEKFKGMNLLLAFKFSWQRK